MRIKQIVRLELLLSSRAPMTFKLCLRQGRSAHPENIFSSSLIVSSTVYLSLEKFELPVIQEL